MAQKDAKQVETMEHIPAKEHGGGFPPFQKETFASQLVWLVLVFVALYLLMSRIALPRIGSILEQRRQHVEADLAEAERLKGDPTPPSPPTRRRWPTRADARRRSPTRRARRRCPRPTALRKDIDAKLAARIAEAEKIIAEAQATAMANVRGIATDAAGAIVERLIGTAPTTHDVAAAVGDVLKR